jgi:hypothetical protein
MKYLFCILAVSCAGLAISAHAESVQSVRPGVTVKKKVLNQNNIARRLVLVRKTANRLERLGRQPVSRKLPKNERKEGRRYNEWLLNTSRTLRNFVDSWEQRIKHKRGLSVAMVDTFNMQYHELQQKISHENRQFTMVSNIMKNKHDTAKNAINNIR